MSKRNAQLELLRRCLDGEATDKDYTRLEELLRNDSEFRKDYLRYLNVDSTLAGGVASVSKQPKMEIPFCRICSGVADWSVLRFHRMGHYFSS